MHAYDLLLARLDAFIRKYYTNQLLRGLLVTAACLLTAILLAGLGEYFFYLPPVVKLPLIGLLLTGGIAALAAWVVRPVMGLARLGKTLRREEAAVIAGRHFPEVGDKMLNLLQLKEGAVSGAETDLLLASVEQKSAQLSVVPIARAIDLGANKRYLKYVLPAAVLLLAFFAISPDTFRATSARLLQPNTTFERPAPFQFVIVGKGPLQVVEGGDFTLQVRTVGTALPAQMEVAIGEERRTMRQKNGVFTATFEKVTAPVPFRLAAGGFFSKPYTLQVLLKPGLQAFRVHLAYPAYTGKKAETRQSMGDLTVPAGTQASWMLATKGADAAWLQLGNGPLRNLSKNTTYFGASYTFLRDTVCTFVLQNKKSGVTERQTFRVRVIPDAPPTLQVSSFRDTTTGSQILVTGTAGDDYGLSRLTLQAVVTNPNGSVAARKSVSLTISGKTAASFQQYFDAGALVTGAGQRLRYWVEAWDNDGVNGPKMVRSAEESYDRTGGKKLDTFLAQNSQQVAQGLSNSSKENEALQENAKELQTQILQSEETSWESKQALQQMADRQEEIKRQLEATKKRFEEGLKQRENRNMSEDAKEKADALKEQMDRLLNKELAAQMEKLNALMEKLNKDRAVQTLQQLESENKLFNMDLERLQELMKKLEQQLRLEDLAGKAEQLAQRQGELQQKTQDASRSKEELAKEQKQLQKDLKDALAKDLKDAKKQSTRAEEKNLNKSEEAGEKAGEQMEKSSESLDQNQRQQSGSQQQGAKEKLQEMAKALREAAAGSSLEQIEIDIRATRQILTNLVRLSFDEESLMGQVRRTSPAAPAYLTNQKEQARLYAASHVIRDSLYTLSKRIFQLAPTVNKETTGLETSLSAANEALSERQIPEAAQYQQYGMTNTNNLALMLNELLSNLMQQQAQEMKKQKDGSGSSGGSPKPGGKPSASGKGGQGGQLSDVITGQKQLGDAMQQAAQSAAQRAGGQKPGEGQEGKDGKSGKEGQGGKGEGGQKPGGEKGGQGGQGGQNGGGGGGNGTGSDGEYGPAEQLVRLAEQQAVVRRQVQALVNKLTGSGSPETARMLREIAKQMDRTEEDLVNRRLTPELAMRQSQIFTRLLEADKALREQEQDNKRAANAGVDVPRPMPAELQRILQQHRALLEGYRTAPAALRPAYREMVERYYQQVGSGKE